MPHLRLLGATELERDDGRSIDRLLAQPKSLALLAYLAAAGNGLHRRDRIVGLFWPEMDDRRARRNFRGRLHLLRKFLGDDVVVSRGDEEVGLDPELLPCDVREFEEAVGMGAWNRALELYRGELLEAFHLNGDGTFLEWLDRRRGELREMAARAARSRSEEAEEAGELGVSVDAARRLVGLAPTDEVAVRRLLLLLDATGDRAGVAAAYEAFASRLDAEYELEPAPETTRLAEELLSRSEPNGSVPNGSAETARQAHGAPARPDRAEALVRGVREREEASGAAVSSTEPLSRSTPESGRQGGSNRGPSRSPSGGAFTKRRYAAGATAVALAALAVAALWSGSSLASGPSPLDGRTIPDMAGPAFHDRVIVVPFENHTGDPSLDVVGHTVADWTAQRILHTGMVEVVSPGEVFRNLLTLTRGRANASDVAMELADGARARILVAGFYTQKGDSVVFQVHITDAEAGTLLRSVPPVSAAREHIRLEPLGKRIMGSLATVIDERLASWTAAASAPPSFEAYQLYAEGLDLFFSDRRPDSAPLLRAAWRADTTFTQPLVWAVFAAPSDLARDTLLAQLQNLRPKMEPWDRAMTDYLLAYYRARPDAATDAAYRALAYAPDSEWAYKLAQAAVPAGRYREAVEALNSIDPDRGWMAEWPAYWGILARAYLGLGQYDRVLETLEEGRARFPAHVGGWPEREAQALVSLGRLDEALAIILPRLSNAESSPPWYHAMLADDWILRLRNHGHVEAADSVGRLALASFEHFADEQLSDPVSRYGHVRLLTQMGENDRAERILETLPEELAASGIWNWHAMALGQRGLLAAKQSDTAGAVEVIQWLTAAPPPPRPWATMRHRYRWAAIIATELGREDEAVRLWREAIRHGQSLSRVRLEAHALRDHSGMRSVLQAR